MTLVLLAAAMTVTVTAGAIYSTEVFAQGGGVVRDIKVVGNRRIEPETVKSYLTFTAGQRYDAYKADESLRALFATGLFQDVRITPQGGSVVIAVVENPLINRVAFEGNTEVKSDTLSAEVQLKARTMYTRAKVQADVQRVLDVYRRQGYYATQVDAQIIELDNNRIDLVFEIREGPETKVVGINFIGNQSFSDTELRGVITTTESSFLDFLKPTSVYDPDRFNLDRELLRRYYLKNGYADMRVMSAVADVDQEGKGFFLTFTIDEGPQYFFGGVDVESTLPAFAAETVRGNLLTKPGDVYNAELVDRTAERLTVSVAEQGFAFGQVRPRIDRDPVNRTISVTYVVEQGPRLYIERINVVGNYRTEDYVIRREFRVAEGDAYNKIMVDQARLRLLALGFFKDVKVNREPGSAPDRVVLSVVVEEQSTGELSFAAGYSSAEGLLGEVSYTERNLLGTGQYLQVKVTGSQVSGGAEVSWTEPRFLDRNLSFGLDAFARNSDYTSSSYTDAGYADLKIGGSVRFGFALIDSLWLNTNYTLMSDEVYDVAEGSSLAVKQIEGTSVISSVGYSLIYDTRNNRKNPSRGFYFSFAQDVAGVGGDVNYIRSIAEGRGYYPITKQITFVGRAIGGNISGWDDQNVRIVDSFFKGGETVRGFATAGLGPRDKYTDDPVGGKNFWAATAEVRFPLPFIPDDLGFGGAVFADVGSVWGSDASKYAHQYCTNAGSSTGQCAPGNIGTFDSNDIRASVGASILWNSPVGPLRADFAYALAKASYDETQVFRFGAATKF
ncbi:outer membrane protein assembly complex, YaeT protein [Rhodomicrobium vannielii ATCC 17100]|uniref:Outer membrane protein assembly factor BamA n=1 Tax=Rhodomicrobium vannielii (strain ATCC 17100 / DSM 162 / LMG 4299 / NCIMB 10020 / ATH 3.1.1) TaxID=648757 RepID=E3I1E7_RHOVT|nr:outer membrane protein assembly factor BamA [Rhodomicrobium vannielii]ADP71238.1 outer membrane protein assembly complex, YaeT protein [Rhodomicrobium vannielii ATCC 17100]